MVAAEEEVGTMSLHLQGVRLPLGEFGLEVDVELQAHVTAFFGASGAGKTTLLDIIAGLRRPEAGRVRLHDKVLSDSAQKVFVPAYKRQIGYVPQDLALFPHLTVRHNLLFGRKSNTEHGGDSSFTTVTDMLDISGLVDRRIGQLSGGEKQRVALGRALLSEPRLLLLDEPLASLDAALKDRILPYLRQIRDVFDIPIVYVSHDPREVLALCDEVLTIEQGRFIRRGKPLQVLT